MILAELCECIYAVPNPFDTLEQRERFEHRDLARMTLPELQRERDRVRLRLTLDDGAPAWILQRHTRIKEALRDAS